MNTRGFAGCVAIALLVHVGIVFGCSFGALDVEDGTPSSPALVWLDSVAGAERAGAELPAEEVVGAETLLGEGALVGEAQNQAERTRVREPAPQAVVSERTPEPVNVARFDSANAGALPGALPGTVPFDVAGQGVEGAGGSGGGGVGRHGLGVRRVTRLGPSAQIASQAHGPRLQAVADPCRGMFPRGAEHDRGSVVVALRVSPSGVPTGPRVIEEFPRGEGFAEAARACLPRLRFEPAADSHGTPVTAESVVRLRFSRG